MAKKKMGENGKAVEAKERKENSKKEKSAAQSREEEDRAWKDAGEGAKTKAQAKKEEQAKLRDEAAAKKAEAKRMAAEEEAALAAGSSGSAKNATKVSSTPKVTAYQLRVQREAEQKEEAAEQRKRAGKAKKMVSEEEYAAAVEAPNLNRDDDAVEARSVTAALAALSTSDALPEDRHPEKRMKAAYAAFAEEEIPRLRQEKPGLKLNQYKDMAFKLWQKSPANPMNQPRPSS